MNIKQAAAFATFERRLEALESVSVEELTKRLDALEEKIDQVLENTQKRGPGRPKGT